MSNKLHSILYLLNIYLLRSALHLSFLNFILPPCILFLTVLQICQGHFEFSACLAMCCGSSCLPAVCRVSKDISPFHHSLCVLVSTYLYERRKWEERNFRVSDVGLCVRSRMRWQMSSKWQRCSAPFFSLTEMDHTQGNQCIDYWLVLVVLKPTTLLHVTSVKWN